MRRHDLFVVVHFNGFGLIGVTLRAGCQILSQKDYSTWRDKGLAQLWFFPRTLILFRQYFPFFWWDLMDSSPDYGTSCAHGEMCTRSSVRVLWLAGNWMSLHFFLESGPTFCGPLIVTHFRVWHVDEEGSWQGQHRRPFAVDTLGQHNKHAALSFSSHSIPSSPRPILHRSQTAVQILPVPSLNFSCDHRQ